MARPETLTAAALVVIGIALAFWLAVMRPPPTPSPPSEPALDVLRLTAASPVQPDLFDTAFALPGSDLGADGLSCGPVLRTEPLGEAAFRVVLSAPCRVGEPVRLTFGPMVFDVLVGSRGHVAARLPHMVGTPTLAARVDDQDILSVDVPQGATRHVIGLSWVGAGDMVLRVNEYGRWIGPNTAGQGRIQKLGDAPNGATSLIYIAPTEPWRGPIRTAVDVDATGACGANLNAVAFDTLGGELIERSVTLRMPACDANAVQFTLETLLDDLFVLGPGG